MLVGGRSRFSLPHAALAAFIFELFLVGALALAVPNRTDAPVPKPQPVELAFPAPPQTPPKPPPPPPPKRVVKPVPPTPRPAVRHTAPHPKPVPVSQKMELPPAPVPTAKAYQVPDPAPAPVPPAPVAKPAPPSVDPAVRAVFEDQVRAAVQAAVQYPYAAKMAHIGGQARVSFSYRDGRVWAVKVVTSSGYDVLDRAALQAVSAASYPPPPANLAGKSLAFEVWVRFTLSDNEPG